MSFLIIACGSALGFFIGGCALIMVSGYIARLKQKKDLKELQILQDQYIAEVEKETERMKRYASMES
jgi:hypothetical protein